MALPHNHGKPNPDQELQVKETGATNATQIKEA